MLKTICFAFINVKMLQLRIDKENVCCFLKGAVHLRRAFCSFFVSLVCSVSISQFPFESNGCEPSSRKEHSNLSYLQKRHPLTHHTHFPARSLRGHRDEALVISSISSCGCDWIMTHMERLERLDGCFLMQRRVHGLLRETTHRQTK